MIRRPPRSTQSRSSAASDVYKRQVFMAVVNIGLCFLLAPKFAAVGVAAANSVALVSQNLLNQWALRASIRTAFIDRECWACYALIVLGAGSLWAFDFLASPGMIASFGVA